MWPLNCWPICEGQKWEHITVCEVLWHSCDCHIYHKNKNITDTLTTTQPDSHSAILFWELRCLANTRFHTIWWNATVVVPTQSVYHPTLHTTFTFQDSYAQLDLSTIFCSQYCLKKKTYNSLFAFFANLCTQNYASVHQTSIVNDKLKFMHTCLYMHVA